MEFLVISPRPKHENVPGARRERFGASVQRHYLAMDLAASKRAVISKARFWYRFGGQVNPAQVGAFVKRVKGVVVDVASGELSDAAEFGIRGTGAALLEKLGVQATPAVREVLGVVMGVSRHRLDSERARADPTRGMKRAELEGRMRAAEVLLSRMRRESGEALRRTAAQVEEALVPADVLRAREATREPKTLMLGGVSVQLGGQPRVIHATLGATTAPRPRAKGTKPIADRESPRDRLRAVDRTAQEMRFAPESELPGLVKEMEQRLNGARVMAR